MENNNEIIQGWDFAAKIFGADMAACFGANYVNSVQQAIHTFEREISKLKCNLGDAQLGGFVAEYWHAYTFNINAAAAGSSHRAWVDETGRIQYGSVDIRTNFGKKYGLKFGATAEETARQQAMFNHETGVPKYLNQERLVPSDQLDEIAEFSAQRVIAHKDKNPDSAVAYQDSLDHLTDRVSDGIISSDELTKEGSVERAAEIKNEEFSAEKHGITVQSKISAENIINEALRGGATAAALTVAIQLAPEIFKFIDYLVKNGEIDPNQIKKMGTKAISASAEGFLRGSIASAVTILCHKGALGSALTSASPAGIGTIVAIVLETTKNSILVATGNMTAQQMGTEFVDSIIITSGCILSAKIGGVIGQAVGIELPIIGYLLGSLLGTAFSVVYNIGKQRLISLCVDTGFTCFGLVDQSYELSDELLEEMGIELARIETTPIEYELLAENEVEYEKTEYEGQERNLETIHIRVLRRGIIGINKIGYVV